VHCSADLAKHVKRQSCPDIDRASGRLVESIHVNTCLKSHFCTALAAEQVHWVTATDNNPLPPCFKSSTARVTSHQQSVP
jgi:hypothetical protein